jgi:hypothetical protein
MVPMVDVPDKVPFDPVRKGVDFIKLGLPPCESQAFYWWKATLEKGAGTEVIDYMCGITDETKTAVAELISGSEMELDLSSMGMPLTCPVAMGAVPGDMAAVAPVFAVFPLIKRDLTVSSDLVENAVKSEYKCTSDKQAGMLRSMYFLGIDTTKEKPEDPNAPPPEPTQYLKDYLLDLWEKCDEINKELLFPLRTDPDLQGKFRGSLICGGKWIGSQFLDILNNDVNMVLGSMSSCLILMSLRCDFLPAFAGIMQIIMSIIAAFIFWGLLGYEKLTTFHNFLFFIIMGIGAAACFVLYDAYLQEQLSHPEEPTEVVFARAYRRAVPAILLTSCTTMMGFLSAGTSAIQGIKTFGFFASLVIIFDFFFAITLFAATFYFCETTLKRYRIQWLFGGIIIGLIGALVGFMQGSAVGEDGVESLEALLGAGIGFFVGALVGAFVGDSSLGPRKWLAAYFEKGKQDVAQELGPFELFFNGPFFNFLSKYGNFILALYLVFTAGMLVTSVLYLETAKEATPFLSADHPIQIFITSEEQFSSGADGERDHVTLIFGLGKEFGAPADSECHEDKDLACHQENVAAYVKTEDDGFKKPIDPDDGQTLPEPIFGGIETLLDKGLQKQIWEKCEKAIEVPFVARQSPKDCEIETVLGVNVYKTPCRPGITCFMQPLKEFIEHFGRGKLGYSWPPGKKLSKAVESFASLGDIGETAETLTWLADPAKLKEEHAKSKSCDPEVVFKWKQIESLPTYEPGFQGKYGFLQKYIEFQKVIGDGFYDIGDYHDFRRESGWYTDDDKVKAMWIRYNASIGAFKPADFIQPIFDDWTHYAEKEFDLGVPVHSNSGGIWSWYATQKEMVFGVTSSITACAILAWMVLAAGTANWILATFAVFTIMSIIVQVMGSLVWFNNPIYKLGPGTLGIIETIGLSIAVGMAVDYTVHIVNAYNNCPSPDRVSRIRYSMTLMGISITLGMIATNIAAMFLLLCVITFFTGFGQFIVMTIFYSWLSAFFILCPLLRLIGPEGRSGEIKFLKEYIGGVSSESNNEVVEIKPQKSVVLSTSAPADETPKEASNETSRRIEFGDELPEDEAEI